MNAVRIFDADNHFWEASDAFTRHRDPKFADRGVRVAQHNGVPRYFIGDRLHPWVPGPGDALPRPKPGALADFFAGRESHANYKDDLTSEDPKAHPEWFNRDARLKVMDEQGLEAAWMFPSQGVCMEGPMQPDVEASVHIIGAFNRWIEEEWGFAYKDRIFAAPLTTLSDLDVALKELEWALSRGARLIVLRPGPAFTRDGMRSPADRMFDPFWARVQEAGITAAVHPGFNDGYQHVDRVVAQTWGIPESTFDQEFLHDKTSDHGRKIVGMLQKKRLVHDLAAVLIAHGLFERFPRLRLAFIETGASWVGPLLHDLQVAHVQNPGMFGRNPVDQFHENCWIMPFLEDDVTEIARYAPADHILFGSDWPHAEGVEQPRDFLAKLAGFPEDDVRKIMGENARRLTFA